MKKILGLSKVSATANYSDEQSTFTHSVQKDLIF
jgi:hypothetical protein